MGTAAQEADTAATPLLSAATAARPASAIAPIPLTMGPVGTELRVWEACMETAVRNTTTVALGRTSVALGVILIWGLVTLLTDDLL